MKNQRPRVKVYIIVVFTFDNEVDQEHSRIHSVYFSKDKAEERAGHLRIQFGEEATVAVLKKTVVDRMGK